MSRRLFDLHTLGGDGFHAFLPVTKPAWDPREEVEGFWAKPVTVAKTSFPRFGARLGG
jgi:hypothetical protein